MYAASLQELSCRRFRGGRSARLEQMMAQRCQLLSDGGTPFVISFPAALTDQHHRTEQEYDRLIVAHSHCLPRRPGSRPLAIVRPFLMGRRFASPGYGPRQRTDCWRSSARLPRLGRPITHRQSAGIALRPQRGRYPHAEKVFYTCSIAFAAVKVTRPCGKAKPSCDPIRLLPRKESSTHSPLPLPEFFQKK